MKLSGCSVGIIGSVAWVVIWLLLYFRSPEIVKYHLTDTLGEVGDTDPVRVTIYSIGITVLLVFALFIYVEIRTIFRKKTEQ